MSDETVLRSTRARRGARDPRWRRVPQLLAAGEALLLRELAERWAAAWPELLALNHLDAASAVARRVLEREPIRPGAAVYRYSLPVPAAEASPPVEAARRPERAA